MAKFSFCIFTVTVLLGRTSADLTCILRELMTITPDHFIDDPDTACRDLDTKFDRARQELKMCLGFEVDVSKVEDLHHEFCKPNSEFRIQVDRQRDCISSNILKSKDCLSTLKNSPSLQRRNIMRTSVADTCRSLSVEMVKCLADKVGGPCGEEGLSVYGRIAQSSESFFLATCFWGANIQDVTGASTAHSAFIWCILIGLLFAAFWW